MDELTEAEREALADWQAPGGRLESLVARIKADAYQQGLADAGGAITWDTTCLNCSRLMDTNYAQYVELEQAKQGRADLAAKVEALADEWEQLAQQGTLSGAAMRWCAAEVRAALAGTSPQGNPDSHEWLGMDR